MHLKSLLILLLSSSLASASPTNPQDLPNFGAILQFSRTSALCQNLARIALLSPTEPTQKSTFTEFYLAPYEDIKNLYEKEDFLNSLKVRKDPDLIVQVLENALSIFAEQPEEDTRLADIALDKQVMDILGDKIGNVRRQLLETLKQLVSYNSSKAVELLLLGLRQYKQRDWLFVRNDIALRALERLISDDEWDRLDVLNGLHMPESDGKRFSRYFQSLIDQYLAKMDIDKLKLLNKVVTNNPPFGDETMFWMADEMVTKRQCSNWNELFSLVDVATISQRIVIESKALQLMKTPNIDESVKKDCQALIDKLVPPSDYPIILTEKYAYRSDFTWKNLKSSSFEKTSNFLESMGKSRLDRFQKYLFKYRGNEAVEWAQQFPLISDYFTSMDQCKKGGQMPIEAKNNMNLLIDCFTVAMSTPGNAAFVKEMFNEYKNELSENCKNEIGGVFKSAIDSDNEEYVLIVREAMNSIFSDSADFNYVFLGHNYNLGEKYTDFVIPSIDKSSIGKAVGILLAKEKFDYLKELLSYYKHTNGTFPINISFKHGYVSMQALIYLLKNKDMFEWGFKELMAMVFNVWDLDLLESVFTGKWIGKTEGEYYSALKYVSEQSNMTLDDVLKELLARSSKYSCFDASSYYSLISWLYVNTENSDYLKQLVPALYVEESDLLNIAEKAIALNRSDDLELVLSKVKKNRDELSPLYSAGVAFSDSMLSDLVNNFKTSHLNGLMRTARRYGRLELLSVLQNKLDSL